MAVPDLTLPVSWLCFMLERVQADGRSHPSLGSEIAFVGKAPGSYLMLLGGGYYGQRLNKIYRGK